MAASQDAMIAARELTTIAEFEEAVQLQKQIWGFEDIELLPRRLFVVASKVGGQTFGCYDKGRMVAFLVAIPGLKSDGSFYLHSHMMGTMADYRNRGLGRTLKLKQREEALSRGIRLVEWTFDPLELKNAWFNIERLGAIIRRYVLNQYGTTTSHLHGGLPTDRCIAEWHLDSAHATAVIEGRTPDRAPFEARISVPVDIAEIRQREPKRAREIQESVSNRFLEHFRNGLAVTGFERTETEGVYLLGKWR